jgi:hypothetical protein
MIVRRRDSSSFFNKSDSQMAVLRTDRALLPGRLLVLISASDLIDLRTIVLLVGIG